MIEPQILELAKAVLTERQLSVWLLIHDAGYSIRGTAVHLDLARSTTVDRYDAACRTLRKHGIMVTPDGRPYLERETA